MREVMMEENIIEIEGKKIDLSRLSDEDLQKLQKNLEKQEGKLQDLINQYREKYPFLGDVK